MKCPECGNELKEQEKNNFICSLCGSKLVKPQESIDEETSTKVEGLLEAVKKGINVNKAIDLYLS